MKHAGITDKIIKAAFKVHNELGFGFLEKVYQNAMVFELRKNGLCADKEVTTDVYYQNETGWTIFCRFDRRAKCYSGVKIGYITNKNS